MISLPPVRPGCGHGRRVGLPESAQVCCDGRLVAAAYGPGGVAGRQRARRRGGPAPRLVRRADRDAVHRKEPEEAQKIGATHSVVCVAFWGALSDAMSDVSKSLGRV